MIREEIEEATIKDVITPQLKKYLGRSDTFIRFSGSKQFKINPWYDQGDISPKGFYGFPFTEKELAASLTSGYGNGIASDENNKNILVFRIKGPILKVSEYTKEMLNKELLKFLNPEDVKEMFLRGNGASIYAAGGNKKGRYWFGNTAQLDMKVPFKTLWSALEIYSKNSRDKVAAAEGAGDRAPGIQKAATWQKKFLELGYSAVLDDKKYKIHNIMSWKPT